MAGDGSNQSVLRTSELAVPVLLASRKKSPGKSHRTPTAPRLLAAPDSSQISTADSSL